MPRVLRHRPFRLLWLSQLVSQVGDRLTLVVLALAVTDLTGEPSDVGLVLAARFAPLVLLVLLGGVWADRLPRRAVMVVSDLARFGLHALLAALFFAGVVEVWQIVVIEALFACAEAFSIPAHQGLIPQTVDEEEIQEATALSQLERNVAQLVGPAIGTAVFAAAGAGWAFAVDAATFVVSAALLLGVHARRRGEPVARTGVWRELADGFREVRARSWLWVTVIVANVWLLVGDGPFTVLGAPHAEDVYGSIASFGVLVTVFGGGMLLGSLFGARLRPPRPLVVGYVASLPIPMAYVAFGLGAPFGLLVPLVAVAGAGGAVFDVLWYTAMAREIPPEALSRATSFDYMGSFASFPLSLLLSGALAEAVGEQEVLVAGGALAGAVVLAGLCVPGVRALRG
jgi:predicted MFS family arabinose efflux permease